MSAVEYGLLIDYEYCTGCHSCEVACQMEHTMQADEWGIKVVQIGPWQLDDEKWEYDFVPVPTDRCDLCMERVAKGKDPTCVHHCQAQVMSYGKIDELMKKMGEKSKMVLFTPKAAATL